MADGQTAAQKQMLSHTSVSKALAWGNENPNLGTADAGAT